jgi:hypothetical protein
MENSQIPDSLASWEKINLIPIEIQAIQNRLAELQDCMLVAIALQELRADPSLQIIPWAIARSTNGESVTICLQEEYEDNTGIPVSLLADRIYRDSGKWKKWSDINPEDAEIQLTINRDSQTLAIESAEISITRKDKNSFGLS